MVNLSRISKSLHFLVFICFLTPFFYTGCGSDADEKTFSGKTDSIAMQDSLVLAVTSGDQDTSVASAPAQADTMIFSAPPKAISGEEETKTPSEWVSRKVVLLRPVLVPKANTYSGVATVMDSAPYVIFFAVFLSFLLLLLGIIIKFIEPVARKSVFLLELVALISLFVAQPYSWNADKLWGLWATITAVFVLSAFDLYHVMVLRKRNARPEG